MTIEVSGSQLAALVRGDAITIGPTKRVITLDDGPFVVSRGGPGSGHEGHAGRPGEVGGSLPSDDKWLGHETFEVNGRVIAKGKQDRMTEGMFAVIDIDSRNMLSDWKGTPEEAIDDAGRREIIGEEQRKEKVEWEQARQELIEEWNQTGDIDKTNLQKVAQQSGPRFRRSYAIGFLREVFDLRAKDAKKIVDQADTAGISSGGRELYLVEEIARKGLETLIVKRGVPDSGFRGHVGREGEVGESAPEGTPGFQRPGMSAYGSGVFTPMLKEVLYGWQEHAGWNIAQMIYTNVVRAQKQGDKDYEGLAISEDGILQGIGALDYNASHPDFEEQVAEENPNFNIEDYLKIDGLYTPDPAFSEELIVQMAAEAAKHGKGVWMIVTDKSGPFVSQMGMSLVGEDYAYWTPEQVAEVAQKTTGLEPTDYYDPPTKPRMLLSFEDAYRESIPDNPITGQPAPVSISEMNIEERYRWENFNYANWAQPERWNPEGMAREQLGVDEEEKLSDTYDLRVVDDLQNIYDGWIDGIDSPWSVRFSEAVADVFGGDAIPESRPRDKYDTPQEFLDVLAEDYGTDVVVPDDVDWHDIDEEEQLGILDEFHAFASGARKEDIAIDLGTVVQSMYDTTQAKLKEAGYSPGDTVRLYRGLQSDPEEKFEGHDGGWANVQQWAVSSWTAAKVVAGNFATMEGERSTIEETGTLLTADVPVEKILANWQTGPGSHGEFEYLVLGESGINAYATKVESARMYRDAKEDVAIEHGESLSDIPEAALGPDIE